MTYTEFGVKAGNSQVKFLKIIETSSSIYFISPFPEVGLHLSFHKPTSQFADFHAHIRSEPLGIHNDLDLDDELFSVDFWESRISKFVDLSVGWLNPTLGDEPVLIIPSMTKAFSFPEKQRRHLIDLGCIFKGPFITTEAKKMPDLFKKLSSIDPLGPYQDMLIGVRDPHNIIAVNKDGTSFEIDFAEIKELFRFETFEESFAAAFGLVIKIIEEKRPTILHSLIPKNFVRELQDSFRDLQPLIMRF